MLTVGELYVVRKRYDSRIKHYVHTDDRTVKSARKIIYADSVVVVHRVVIRTGDGWQERTDYHSTAMSTPKSFLRKYRPFEPLSPI